MQKMLLVAVLMILGNRSYSQKLYAATGHASFYAGKFDGRKTASGEIFSNKKMTAAHLSLPFGTIVKVTNLKNNKSVVVRINDRGPYVRNRIIDLSRIAADSLDFIHSGWTMVKIEELPPEPVVAMIDPIQSLEDTNHLRFPEDWLGTWKGVLKIYSYQGLSKKVPMKLRIHSLESAHRYEWTMVYDSIPRNYELVRRDSSKGIYSLDEKNGIDIMGYSLGNHFLTRFSVMGNLLDCEYQLLSRDEMIFEIRTGKEEHNWTTGNVSSQNDSIPQVEVFGISNLQVATLQRVNE